MKFKLDKLSSNLYLKDTFLTKIGDFDRSYAHFDSLFSSVVTQYLIDTCSYTHQNFMVEN